ncbi:MAG TPA: radical SAM protein [Polyangiaceae bacterium]|nr:radical SAM protein [Polyangiaceae bacterium]
MSTLTRVARKSLLYRSGLGFFCINHVQGCSHGCRYPCHAWMIFNRHGRVHGYADWCTPRLVGNALELLDHELRKKRSLPDRVHLCLSTDPFMTGQPEVEALSLALIARLNQAGVPCTVLTKGALPEALADTERFHPKNHYGISLVSLSERFRIRWEPGATAYDARIEALRALHSAGCFTYVHMEPYPTPNIILQDVNTILERVDFVARIYFGGWNYSAIVQRFADAAEFYRRTSDEVRDFCTRRGIQFETS